MITLQILSDIHLEIWKTDFEFRIKAPYLVLAGDIADPGTVLYEKFLLKQADRFEKVFVIAGNHESHHRSMEETEELISEICSKKKNLIFMNCDFYDLDEDYIIVGCTLWSKILASQRPTIEKMADFRLIRNWDVDKNNERHAKERKWLEKEIELCGCEDKQLIVVTHHCPSFTNTCRLEHRGGSEQSLFCTSMDGLLKPPVALYVFGHSHYSVDKRLGSGCRLVANQRGYPGENTGFNPEFTVTI